jgi:predicted dehydrogenase
MRVGVIGLGSAGRRHAENLQSQGHTVTGWDPDPAQSALGIRAATLDELLDAVEAVIVASPSATHADQAIAALEAGHPVLVEKPLATSIDDAEQVAEAAARSGSTCGVAMNLRFHPGVVRVRELLVSGALGEPMVVQASMGYALPLWRPGTDYSASYSARADLGGGILWDAIHELDYLLWMLGPVRTVSAELGRLSDLEIDVEDTVMAILRFASGAMASVDLNFVEPAYRRGCLVAGSAAVACWDWAAGTVAVRADGTEDRVERLGDALDATYRAELDDFVAAIAAGGSPRTSADEGVSAVRLAAAIREAAATGRRVAIGTPAAT